MSYFGNLGGEHDSELVKKYNKYYAKYLGDLREIEFETGRTKFIV